MKQYHHGNLRNELIEAGINLVQQVGIEKLSLRKLAAQCGVSEAAPYKHFANKEELLDAMQAYVTDQLMNSLTEAEKNSGASDSPDVILNMGKAYISFFMKYPAYYSFLFREARIRIDLTANISKENYQPFEYFKRKSYEVYRKLGYSDECIKYEIIGMWAKVHGLSAITSMEGVTKDFEWDEVWNQILID